MKLLIASDIHGDYYYTKKLIDVFEEGKFEKLILLGDILYHGPRNDLPEGYNVKEVFELLNKYKDKIVCVRGNCDAEIDEKVLDFDISELSKEMYVDGYYWYLTHGHRFSIERLPQLPENAVFFQGHTHKSILDKIGNNVYAVNPGSISIPKDNHHSYVTYEDKVFKLFEFDDKLLKEMEIK